MVGLLGNIVVIVSTDHGYSDAGAGFADRGCSCILPCPIPRYVNVMIKIPLVLCIGTINLSCTGLREHTQLANEGGSVWSNCFACEN